MNINSDANQKHPYGILWRELNDLVYVQANLIYKGYLARGGLTIGDIYIKPPVVVGPALIQAYALESQFAVYPLIVVDPAVLDEFEKSPYLRKKGHSLDDEKGYLRDLLRRDADGLYFVDYLLGMLDFLDAGGEDLEFLGVHKSFIIENAAAHKNLSSVAAKMLWMAQYHNESMRRLTEDWFHARGVESSDFLVQPGTVPLLYEL